MPQTRNKVALVTGAGSGLGFAIARRLSAEGYFIILNGRDAKRLAIAQKNLGTGAAKKTALFPADVAAKMYGQALDRLMAKEDLSHLDLVVHCAGINHMGTVKQVNPENAESTFRVNAFSVIGLAHAVEKYLELGGNPRFVYVSSLMQYFSMPGRSVYAASKAAGEKFAEAWGHELAVQGSRIRVQIFRPAGIETGFHANTPTDGLSPRSDVSRMSPHQVADYLFTFIHSGKFAAAPGLMNKIVAFTARHFPRLTGHLARRRFRRRLGR